MSRNVGGARRRRSIRRREVEEEEQKSRWDPTGLEKRGELTRLVAQAGGDVRTNKNVMLGPDVRGVIMVTKMTSSQQCGVEPGGKAGEPEVESMIAGGPGANWAFPIEGCRVPESEGRRIRPSP